jgi:hypothetical protein
MKWTIGIIGIALLLSCGGARVMAQTDALAPKANETKAETVSQTYRLTYTLTEIDGSKRIGTQHYAVTVSADEKNGWNFSRIKLGSKVPIATASTQPDKPARTEFQYVDVGLNIEVRVRQLASGVEVNSDIDQSSVSEETSSVGSGDPVIRQTVLKNTALLTPGKPVMLGSMDLPGSTRHLDIEVVLEVIR